MKTIKISIFIFLFFSFNLLLSQQRRDPFKAGVLSNNLDVFAVQKIDQVHNDGFLINVDGNHYLNKEWKKCHIASKDDKHLSLPCNYNLHDDKFEMKLQKEVYFLKSENIKSINFDDKKFIPFPNNSSPDDYSKYYELITSGRQIKLIKRFKLKLNSAQSTQSLGTFIQKIQIKEALFFLFDDGKLIEVPKSKSKIFKLLNLNESLYKEFKKQNLKDIATLSKLITSL